MAGFVGPEIPGVTDGLVFYVDAALTYTSGSTIWYDKINGNNGTLTNGPIFSTEVGGNFVFDGVNDTARFSGLSISPDSSVSLWVKWISNGGTLDRIYSTSPVDNFEIGINGTSGLVQYYPNGSTAWQSVGASLTVNKWQHLTFTFAGGNTVKFYLDGQLIYSGTGQINPGNDTYLATRYSGGEAVNCQISNFMLYNKTLTADEVLQNYNATN